MKTSEIRKMNKDEINSKIVELKKELSIVNLTD